MVVGNLLVVLTLVYLAFISRLWQLQAAYAVMGLGAGIGGPIAASTLTSNWFIKKIPLAMSIVTGSGAIG